MDPKDIFRNLQANASSYASDAIDYDTFRAQSVFLWDLAEDYGLHDAVMALWREQNGLYF